MKNISYWQQTTIAPVFPRIEEDMDIDVAIIGGGMTGIMCAYYLRNSGKKIVVFEQERIASQTTGHTTAKVSYIHQTIYQFLIHNYSIDIAKKYLESNKQAMKDIENIIETEKIECDYQKNMSFIYSKNPKESVYIEKEIKALRSLGVDVWEDIHQDTKSIKSLAVDEQAIFHPLKYLYHIVEVCRKSGILFYENSKAYQFDLQADQTIFFCNQFKVTSKETILATRYPQINVPEFYFLKLAQKREHVTYTPNKESPNSYLSIDNPNESYRPVSNGSIYAGNAHNVGDTMDTIKISEISKNKFGNDKIIAWSAQDTVMNRGIPYIGHFSSKYKHCYIAFGYHKWGMTLSHVSAKLLSDYILHRYNPYHTIYAPGYGNMVVKLQSFGSLLKSSFKGMISNRFAPLTIQLHKGEGKIVRIKGRLLAVYKDYQGYYHFCKPYCRHLKCIVSFNQLEKTWDCPCHGSRYDMDGRIIEGPAIVSLKKIK